ncbi:MAG: type II toxin-antitoxin system RelE/ParE family toxin [Rhodomicrobium sp.]
MSLALIRLSAFAEEDIVAILRRTHETFGEPARFRYEALFIAALRDIAADPLRPGSVARPEVGGGIRTYHLRHSRAGAQSGGGVRKPRHFLLYRCLNPEITGISRVLHDAMDIERQVPSVYGDED